MDLFNIISGVCSIAGLAVSLFTAGKVIKITQSINCNNKDVRSDTKNKVSKSTINGLYVGGNSINGTRDNK
ncbi:MAG: hypothetical protein HFH72_11885 [Lachnospiraceae bacterium]|nr:hypothetical protein [Lachnospiraceae bacterium]